MDALELAMLINFADMTVAIKPLVAFFTGLAGVTGLIYVGRRILANIR